MSQIEHNGDNFEYIVTYQPRGDSTEAEVTDVISDWTKGRLVIPNQPTFQEYVISVGTRNEMGAGPVTTILGYSGEDGKIVECHIIITHCTTLNKVITDNHNNVTVTIW